MAEETQATEDQAPDLSLPPPDDSLPGPELETPELADDDRIQQLTTENEDLQAQIGELQERQQLLDTFERDPEGTLRHVAERLGMELMPRGGTNGTGADQANDDPPQRFVDAISRNLPPEMQFMTNSIAKASWVANREAQRPFQEQLQAERNHQRMQERNAISAEMNAKHPGWDSDKSLGEMAELLNFLAGANNGGPMRHPKFGTAQELLFNLIAGEGNAVRAAAERMRDAAQNATSESSNQGPSPLDVAKQIAGATSRSDKLTIALRAAMAEHGSL